MVQILDDILKNSEGSLAIRCLKEPILFFTLKTRVLFDEGDVIREIVEN